MKNILKIFVGLVSIILFTTLFYSCERDLETEGLTSGITNYAVFDYLGEEVVLHPLGQPFVDPGVTATENGQPVTVSISVSGLYTGYSGTTVNVNVPDQYTITYKATNSDNFDAFTYRDVYVSNTGDLVNSIEGLYISTVVRNNVSAARYSNLKYVFITKTGENKYKLSCGIGGYYQLGRPLGITYSAPVTITANDIASNDFTLPPFTVRTFGGVVNFNSFTVDAASKTIHFVNEWDFGYVFDVTLKQVQI